MIDWLDNILKDKRVGILGFGLEGRSTYRLLREHAGEMVIDIADRDEGMVDRAGADIMDEKVRWHTGPGYLDPLTEVDILFKSPGIQLPAAFRGQNPGILVTSQTDLLLAKFRSQVIGITGTKGKSTTSSLIHHILKSAGLDSMLIGNIGLPAFDHLHRIKPDTHIVCELSSHQLEDAGHSPQIAVLLNLYPEHLDRYMSIEEYYAAKWNIFLHQEKDDIFIFYDGIDRINLPGDYFKTRGQVLRYGTDPGIRNGCFLREGEVHMVREGTEAACCRLTDDLHLKGRHNRLNMMAAILACHSAGVAFPAIMEGISTFHGLEHRLEYVGNFKGIDFYNDSIATIPEATLEAIDTIQGIQTLILGGFDRNLDYAALMEFLMGSDIANLIFMGKAGERMLQIARSHERNDKHRLFKVNDFHEVAGIIREYAPPGSVCLLSPAASSYDSFKNFEDRGRQFKKMAREL